MFHFQPLQLQDIPLIQQLGRETYEPYYPHIWHPGGIDWYMDLCFNETVLTRELNDPNFAYYVARGEQGATVGLLKLVLHKPVPGGGQDNALYLEKIYLMPAFFGTGAGQALIHFTLERARELGKKAVWLMVLKNGPVKAYERAGFEVVADTRWEFDLLKEAERDGLIMQRAV